MPRIRIFLFVQQRGFTLVEIAIGMMVIAIGMGLGISLLGSLVDTQKIRVSNSHLDTVTQALVDYVGKNSHLPCPAVPTLLPTNLNYGVANSNATCTAIAGAINVTSGGFTTAIGVVPWITLGITQDMVVDGYGDMLTYLVTINTPTGVNPTASDANSVTYMQGSITSFSGTPVQPGLPNGGTQNQINGCSQTPNDDTCRLAGVAALISYGKNGLGSYVPSGTKQSLPDSVAAPEEYENANLLNAQLVVPNPALRSAFDDLVRVLSPTDILSPLSKAGIVMTPTALTRQRLQVLKSALLSYVAQSAGNTLPDAANSAALGTSVFGVGRISQNGATFAIQATPLATYIPWKTLGLPSYFAYDGWGTVIYYQLDSTLASGGLHASTPPGTNLGFRIQSIGLNGTKDNTDDVYVDTSVNEIRGLMTSTGIQYNPN